MNELLMLSGGSITLDEIITGVLVGAVMALFANLIIFFSLRRMVPGGIQVVRPGQTTPEALPPYAVAAATLIPAVGAGVVLWLLAQNVAQPLPLFIGVSVVLLLLSLVAPVRLPVANRSKGVLILMHFTAAVGIVVGLLWAVRVQ
jgi:hypothetical protein